MVGVVRFEQTQPKDTIFTVLPTSPTVAHPQFYKFKRKSIDIINVITLTVPLKKQDASISSVK